MDKDIQDWVLVKQADCEDSITKSSDESDDNSIINITEEDDSATHQKELQDIESISTETYQQENGEHNKETDAAQTENLHARPISCEGSISDEETDNPEETILHLKKEAISSAEKAEDFSAFLISEEGASCASNPSKLDSAQHVLEGSIRHIKSVANSQSVSDEYQHSEKTISDENAACEGNMMQPESEAEEGPRNEEKSHKEADLKVKLTQHVDSYQDLPVVCEKLSVFENESFEILKRNTFTVTAAIPQHPAPLLEESGIDMKPRIYLAEIPGPTTTAQVDSNPLKIESFAETPLGLHSDKSTAPSEELNYKFLVHSSELLLPTIKERSITDKRPIPAKRSFLGNSKRWKAKATRKCFIPDKISSKELKKTGPSFQATTISKRASNTKHIKRNTSELEPNKWDTTIWCIVVHQIVILLCVTFVVLQSV